MTKENTDLNAEKPVDDITAKAPEAPVVDTAALITAERQRIAGIQATAHKLAISAEFTQQLIDAGTSLVTAKSQMTDWLAEHSPVAGIRSNASLPANEKKPMSESLEGEPRYEAEWAENRALAAEFLSKGDYLAYRAAEDAGRIKIKSDR